MGNSSVNTLEQTQRSQPWLLVVVVLSFAIACASAVLSFPTAPQKLVVLSPVQDLGNIGQGEELQTSFELRNDCGRSVTITQLECSCTCTAARLEKSSLKPGETVEVPVKFESGRARGNIASRCVARYVEEGLEAPRIVKFSVRANCLPDIIFEPKQLLFSTEGPKQQEIMLHPGQFESFKVHGAYFDFQGFSVSIDPSKQAGTEISVIVSKTDATDWKFRTGHLNIKTNSPNEPILRIPIRISNSPAEKEEP